MRRAAFATVALLFSAATLIVVGQAPTLPGTSADRVGFPTGYTETYKQLAALDVNQTRGVRVIWANDVAQSVDPNQPWNFPYGSILVFEDFPAVTDDNGEPVLDDNGRFVRGDLRTVFVMRKERGFGAEYGPVRNGEWEYVSYKPDGTYATTPQNSGACALCHMTGSSLPMTNSLPPINARNDYVFRAASLFTGESGALPRGVMQNYLFVPGEIHVKAGTPVTIYNDDEIVHRVAADDGSFDSGYMGTGATFTIQTTEPGEIAIHCPLHSRMKGKIVVDPPDSASATAARRR